MVNHAAAKGAPFDTAAASEFFLTAFSRYRQDLDAEGELKILASVDRKRRGHGCNVTDPNLVTSTKASPEPSPTPSPTGSGLNNWEFLPCGPRDPLREFHDCDTPSANSARSRSNKSFTNDL